MVLAGSQVNCSTSLISTLLHFRSSGGHNQTGPLPSGATNDMRTLCFLFLMVPVVAFADNWTQIPGLYNGNDLGFVDLGSVRVDAYPKGPYAVDSPKNYLVAWIATKDQNDNLTQELETVYDC